jgi:hypothetical protein
MQGVEMAWPEGVGVRREEDVGRRSLVDGIRVPGSRCKVTLG